MFPCNYASVCIRDFLLLDFRSVYSAAGAMLPGAGRMEDVLMMCLESKKGGPRGEAACVLSPSHRSLAVKGGDILLRYSRPSLLIKENIERQQERSNTVSDLGIHPT